MQFIWCPETGSDRPHAAPKHLRLIGNLDNLKQCRINGQGEKKGPKMVHEVRQTVRWHSDSREKRTGLTETRPGTPLFPACPAACIALPERHLVFGFACLSLSLLTLVKSNINADMKNDIESMTERCLNCLNFHIWTQRDEADICELWAKIVSLLNNLTVLFCENGTVGGLSLAPKHDLSESVKQQL